jgi:hypothetical protein
LLCKVLLWTLKQDQRLSDSRRKSFLEKLRHLGFVWPDYSQYLALCKMSWCNWS